jgi:hypothetical protein
MLSKIEERVSVARDPFVFFLIVVPVLNYKPFICAAVITDRSRVD